MPILDEKNLPKALLAPPMLRVKVHLRVYPHSENPGYAYVGGGAGARWVVLAVNDQKC